MTSQHITKQCGSLRKFFYGYIKRREVAPHNTWKTFLNLPFWYHFSSKVPLPASAIQIYLQYLQSLKTLPHSDFLPLN